MNNKRLLDHDPDTGVSTFHAYDHDTDTTYIETVQDVAPILRRNRALANEDDYKKEGIKNEWLHIASIPIGVQHQWLKQYGVDIYKKDHWPRVKRLLMDPDWRYLRTSLGGL